VTRGWLPQRAGFPNLNGGWTAAVVPPKAKGTAQYKWNDLVLMGKLMRTGSTLVVPA